MGKNSGSPPGGRGGGAHNFFFDKKEKCPRTRGTAKTFFAHWENGFTLGVHNWGQVLHGRIHEECFRIHCFMGGPLFLITCPPRGIWTNKQTDRLLFYIQIWNLTPKLKHVVGREISVRFIPEKIFSFFYGLFSTYFLKSTNNGLVLPFTLLCTVSFFRLTPPLFFNGNLQVARRKELLDSVASRCREEGADGVLVLPLDLGEMGNNGKAVDAAVEEFGSESHLGKKEGFIDTKILILKDILKLICVGTTTKICTPTIWNQLNIDCRLFPISNS